MNTALTPEKAKAMMKADMQRRVAAMKADGAGAAVDVTVDPQGASRENMRRLVCAGSAG